MALFLDIVCGSVVLQNLYCRVRFIGGHKQSAHYQIELMTDQHGQNVPALDITQMFYTFADRKNALPFDVTQPPWPQAYADLKDRFRTGLLTWCNAMREENGSAVS